MAKTYSRIDLTDYFEQFAIQSKKHPGGTGMRSFYAALSSLKDNKELETFLKEVVASRMELNPQHFSTLFPRAIQYMLYITHNNREYPKYSTEEWVKFILKLVQPKSVYGQEVKYILATRNTNSTISARYLGPKIIINGLYPDQKVHVTEFGASIGFGIRELEHKKHVGITVKDMTPDKIISRLGVTHLNIAGGVAIDRENLESDVAWVASCSVYFQEIDKLEELLEAYAHYKKSSKIKLHQADMLDIELVVEEALIKPEKVQIPLASSDVSMALTALYELSSLERTIALENMRKVTKPNGVVIVQDFFGLGDVFGESAVLSYLPLKDLGVEDNRAMIQFKDFYGEHTYRTLVFMLDGEQRFNRVFEVFRWNHARCEYLYPGSDYNKFLWMLAKES